jgi:activator of Hsp90 ATPase-like protein
MRNVEVTIDINCSARNVFNAFVDENQLKEWWQVERSLIEAKQGGIYSLAWNVTEQGFQFISTGLITIFNPGQELLIDHFVYFNPEKSILGPTYLSVKLEDATSFTKLKLVQGGYQRGKDWDWFYEAVKNTWPIVLAELKNFLEK